MNKSINLIIYNLSNDKFNYVSSHIRSPFTWLLLSIPLIEIECFPRDYPSNVSEIELDNTKSSQLICMGEHDSLSLDFCTLHD